MDVQNTKKDITLDDLAEMVAEGFNGVNERMDKMESEIQGLRSSVNNYLQLSDKRYLELKARQDVIVNWVKQIGDKTGVKINLEELEKVA